VGAVTYSEFWLYYLRAHAHPGTRLLHYLGSLCGLALLAAAAAMRDWRLVLLALVVGYGLAWIGHALIERNRPATFGHPFWSLASDFRMAALWASGRLGPHLARARAAG